MDFGSKEDIYTHMNCVFNLLSKRGLAVRGMWNVAKQGGHRMSQKNKT
jgi:hypothetical protein